VGESGTEVEPDGSAPETRTVASHRAPLSPSDAALARYKQTMRRRRRNYYLIVGAIVAVVAVVVGVVWSRGEVAHTSLRTFAPAPPTVGVDTPSQSLTPSWHTTDRIAIGAPQWGGTIITFSKHTVGGRDARTGKRTWAYTRTNRTVCTATQQTGTTIAVYKDNGNCDEVSAFDSGTGQRRWTRTLDIDGMPLDGQPTLQATGYTLLAYTADVIYALDPVSGYNRWTYQRYGCDIEHVVIGSTGALISQNCSTRVKCANLKFCGPGQQLLLRDGSAARGDDSKPDADQIKWSRFGDRSVPASADQVVSALDANGRDLDILDPGKGTPQRMPLNPEPANGRSITAIPAVGAELIWISGESYVVRSGDSAPAWAADSPAPPTVVSTTGEDVPTLATARITVPTQYGIGVLDGNDGATIQQFTVAPHAPASLVYSLGTGFLVAGNSGIVAYK
jgi:PQQ-like domain